ncbi:MAG: LacI family transcriptional regulator [Sphingobacteriales bacterium]|nr:MAG: LacI family transcriptional regulator [Sphingobacteriales bacterium]
MKKGSENTMKDIALELGLSSSTVSRALQDHPHISQETKIKVNEAANRLGYSYNAVAASLRNSKSNTIGLIIPRISKYYQSTVITAIQNKLHEHKYNLMICQSNESPELEKELVNALYASRVEGLIVSSTLNTTDFSHFDVFSRSNRPLVFFDRVPKNYPAHKIQGDDYHGANLATNHLLSQGCRNIAFIGGPLFCNLYRERYEGYSDALKSYDLSPDSAKVFFHDLTKENALLSCEKLFSGKRENWPDAVFCCNDTVALTVTSYAKNRDVEIPGQLKVTGYSNDPLTEIIKPTITSVEQYPSEVGTQAAGMIMNLIQQKLKPGKNYISVTIAVDLVKRDSTEK